MKIVTLFGTRPEIIRLSLIIKLLDRFCDHVLVHTGQNYDEQLSDVFFRELDLRAPDLHLDVQSTDFADQVSQVLVRADRALEDLRPDRVLILGDTNSGLAAISAARRRIPVYHLEAGNRCYDDRVPEEINRRIIDQCSAVLMPYTHRSKENLVHEGIPRDRIFVTGNPIYEVLTASRDGIERSEALRRLKVEPQQYFLATLHRAENVDNPSRLANLLEGLARVAEAHLHPVVVSLHPRTADRMQQFGISARSSQVRLLPPMGFFDFVALERHAMAVLTDSGTVQEECAIFRVPNVTIRDVTERAETIECGSNMLTGDDPEAILSAVKIALETGTQWAPPPEYLEPHVSRQVAKIVLGYRVPALP